MEATMENKILQELHKLGTELHDFREENNKRWEENDKRWEQNEKRWEENDKRWEQNEKRWEENDKRWKQNEKRWQENDKKLYTINKRIDETNERIDQTNDKLDQTNKIMNENNKRITALEEGRIKDRNDILVVLEAMQESISNQFTEMREYMDAKFEKIFASQRANEVEHEEFKKWIYAHDKRLDFHSARLGYLEKWKDDFDMGEYTAV